MVEAANTLNTLLSILKVWIMKEVSQSDSNFLFFTETEHWAGLPR